MSGAIPEYKPRTAPDGLATKRQLDAVGLRPGGVDPVAQLVWPGGVGPRCTTSARRSRSGR